MSLQSRIRRIMAIANDINAVTRTAETGDPTYITNRIGRRIIYRAASRAANTLFPPHRWRHRRP